MPSTTRVVLLLFTIMGVLAASAPAAEGWRLFTSPDGDFAVSMPGAPQISTKVRGPSDITVYVAGIPGQCNYTVERTSALASTGSGNCDRILDNFAQGFSSEEQAVDLSVVDTMYAGAPARWVRFRRPDGRPVEGYILYADGRVYLVFTFPQSASVVSQKAYFDSFRLLR